MVIRDYLLDLYRVSVNDQVSAIALNLKTVLITSSLITHQVIMEVKMLLQKRPKRQVSLKVLLLNRIRT